MKVTSAITFLSLLGLGQATGSYWGSEKCYSSPGRSPNECNDHQQKGFSWSDLSPGSFSNYGGFSFSGFTCGNGFGSSLGKRGTQKCISGTVSRGSSYGSSFGSGSSAPSFACSSHESGFSVTDFHVATDKDTELHIIYSMPDGSTCKNTASCNSGGTKIHNDQCGGATSVHFELPDDSEHESCGFGIYSVGFDCTPGSTITRPVPGTTVAATSVPQASETGSSSSVVVVFPPGSVPGSSVAPVTTPAVSTPVRMTTSTVYTTSEITITSCAASVTNCPAGSGSTTVVTSTIAVSTTVCPVTETAPAATDSPSLPPVPTPTGVLPGSSSAVPTPSGTVVPSSSAEPSSEGNAPTETPGPSSPVVTSPVRMTTSTVYATSEVTITRCASSVTDCPAGSGSTTVVTSTIAVSTTVPHSHRCLAHRLHSWIPSPGATSGASASISSTPLIPGVTSGVSSSALSSPVVTPTAPGDLTTTIVTWEKVTTCPVTNTVTSGSSTFVTTSQTVSTVTLTSTSTICTRCTASSTPVPGTSETPEGSSPVEATSSAPTGPGVTGPSESSAGPKPTSAVPEGATTTVVTYVTETTCPVTNTVTSGSSTYVTTSNTISTITVTSVSTLPCTKCTATATTTPFSPTTTTIPAGPSDVSPAPSPSPASPCPNTVPQCINTWLNLVPKCNSNSDASCFCPNSEFTSKVISCIQAWGASKAEIQSALSYFTGICATWIPQNPGIVTEIPTTITLIPTVAPTPGPSGVDAVTGGGAPVTSAPELPCTTITYSTYTVTVPQVSFVTSTGTESGAAPTVGLVPAGPSGASPANPGNGPVTASATFVTASSGYPSASASVGVSPSESPIFNVASGVSVTSSLMLASIAAFFGLML
ncbi:hypothetical protein N7535_004071 [Penicillium sp. DV-2018c]|nr:hypothetical protein N7535_004071 [Penicillium sp. DV-2018c]